MSEARNAGGWDWFEPGAGAPRESVAEIEKSFARCFRDADGERVLAHLREITLGRVLGPEASDSALRMLEGQRQLVAYIATMIARGRGL